MQTHGDFYSFICRKKITRPAQIGVFLSFHFNEAAVRAAGRCSLLTFSRSRLSHLRHSGAPVGSRPREQHPQPGLPGGARPRRIPPGPGRPGEHRSRGHRRGLGPPRLLAAAAPPSQPRESQQARRGAAGGRCSGRGAEPSGDGPAGSRPPPAAPPPLPVMAAAGQWQRGGAARAGAFGC